MAWKPAPSDSRLRQAGWPQIVVSTRPAVAVAELLGAAHVVRDRDQDREALAELAGRAGSSTRPAPAAAGDRSGGLVPGPERERGDLAAELARVPLGVTGGPAPKAVGELLRSGRHGAQYNRSSVLRVTLAETLPRPRRIRMRRQGSQPFRPQGGPCRPSSAHHDVKDTDHWLASSRREEFFGPLGITNVRTFVDPQNPNRVGILLDVPDGRARGRAGERGGSRGDGARRGPPRDARDAGRAVAEKSAAAPRSGCTRLGSFSRPDACERTRSTRPITRNRRSLHQPHLQAGPAMSPAPPSSPRIFAT